MWGVLAQPVVGPPSQNVYNLKYNRLVKRNARNDKKKNSPRAKTMIDIVWACLHKFLAFAYPVVAIFIGHPLSSHCLLIPVVIQTLQAGACSSSMTLAAGFGHGVSQVEYYYYKLKHLK